MFPAKVFPVLLIKSAFFFAGLKLLGDLLHRQLKGVGDIASSSRYFLVSLIFEFFSVISEERVINLYPPYPDRCFWGERDAAAFDFSADFFGPPHICLPFFVYANDSVCPLVSRVPSCVGIV